MAVINKAESLSQLEDLLRKEISRADLAGQEVYCFNPRNGDAYDVMRVRNTRVVSMWGGLGLKELLTDHPESNFGTSADLMQIRNEIHRQPVSEIEESDFMSALECMPPVEYKVDSIRNASFKLSERYIDNLTSIYMQVEGRYFKMRDDISTPHDQCISRAREFMALNEHQVFSSPSA